MTIDFPAGAHIAPLPSGYLSVKDYPDRMAKIAYFFKYSMIFVFINLIYIHNSNSPIEHFKERAMPGAFNAPFHKAYRKIK